MDNELLVVTEDILALIMTDLELTEEISAPGRGLSGLIGICPPELTDAILALTIGLLDSTDMGILGLDDIGISELTDDILVLRGSILEPSGTISVLILHPLSGRYGAKPSRSSSVNVTGVAPSASLTIALFQV